jgi:uncharacterized protein (UPF0335 family)
MTQPTSNSDPDGRMPEYVERVANLLVDVKAIQDDIRDVCAEAKQKSGYDPKIIRALAKRKNETSEQRGKREALASALERYAHACGLLD